MTEHVDPRGASGEIERFDRLDAAVREGRVLRSAWTDGQGRACLLATLAPEVLAPNGDRDVARCPAEVIAPWLAHLTPPLDDNGTAAAWPAFVARYAATVRRCAVLTPEDWRRADYAVRAGIVRLALPHAGAAAAAVEEVIALCDESASGGAVSDDRWGAARAAARAAGRAASAGDAAWAAVSAAGRADARAAARAAMSAAARAAAWAAAWDVIATLTLDTLDAACAAREATKGAGA